VSIPPIFFREISAAERPRVEAALARLATTMRRDELLARLADVDADAPLADVLERVAAEAAS
jgi:hypothetical protein